MSKSCATCRNSIGTYNGGLNCKAYGFELIRFCTASVDENQRNDARNARRAMECEKYDSEEQCPMCYSFAGIDYSGQTAGSSDGDGNPRCRNCGCY